MDFLFAMNYIFLQYIFTNLIYIVITLLTAITLGNQVKKNIYIFFLNKIHNLIHASNLNTFLLRTANSI